MKAQCLKNELRLVTLVAHQKTTVMLERLGYFFLIIALVVWIYVLIKGLVDAFPEGLIGFIVIAGFGFLFFKVVKDRLKNKEDDYYDKNVDK